MGTVSLDDATRAPRPGEELDVIRLTEFLKKERPDLNGPIEIAQFPSGHSNLTYLVRVGDEELVLRRPPFGKKPKSGHDMHREWVVLSALSNHFPYIPEPIAYCGDESVLGAPFFLMRRIKGLILRRDLPEELHFTQADMRELCRRVVDVHRELHELDYRKLGMETLGHPEGYVERQISGWSRRFRNARTPDVPGFEGVMAWLEENRPQEKGAAIIHNDYRFDNVVLDPADPLKVIGVLDWEMATIGDPLMDLGASLAYWVEANDPPGMQAIRLIPTTCPGALTRLEVVNQYLGGAGLEVEDFTFYFVYGLFRLAGIAQQIYYRFYHGQVADPRFGHLGKAVQVLEAAARKSMAEHVV
ncbi:MAG: phosphotransferase family protein [Acidobacteria bacterium]|nr:phosphotransferase family protein [Acidobacteriota bacterium]